ncbi:MAG: amidinotransferase [Saprospiraceae bacterium]|nr:amidinotransferase [Saprospiraceae bacterium]
MNLQCTDTIMMIRPVHFGFNPQTAANNSFQSDAVDLMPEEINMRAQSEFDRMVESLQEVGVNIHLVEDTPTPEKPDAIFPNNWITTHANGAIITYPMQSPLRRKERREDIIQGLMKKFKFDKRYSLEYYEDKDLFLEGTGSMILDRIHRKVYSCISKRTDPTILDKFCALTGYRRVVFNAIDSSGMPVYHTNVMMSIGSEFCLICLDAIDNSDERKYVEDQLKEGGRKIIEISVEQMNAFAGNILQLQGSFERQFIIMSSTAFASLTESQILEIQEFATIIHSSLDTIEFIGGGSARCMIAEIFVPGAGYEF